MDKILKANILIFYNISEYLNIPEIIVLMQVNQQTKKSIKSNLLIQNRILKKRLKMQTKDIKVDPKIFKNFIVSKILGLKVPLPALHGQLCPDLPALLRQRTEHHAFRVPK